MFPKEISCPCCNEPLNPIGPLWLGSIQHKETLMQMRHHMDAMVLVRKRVGKLIDLCLEELPTSGYYDYHQLAKITGRSPPPIDTVIERIIDSGYPATRTHFSGYGIKTEAPLSVILMPSVLCNDREQIPINEFVRQSHSLTRVFD